MTNVYLIMPGKISEQLLKMAEAATENVSFEVIKDERVIPNLQNKKIIFAVELDVTGLNIPIMKILSLLHARGNCALSGSSAVVLIHSQGQLFTKSTAQHIIFLANQLGCRFPGNPVVEATENLNNFLTWQKKLNMPVQDICLELCIQLGKRLVEDKPVSLNNPRILALHSSNHETSNTLMLWNMVKKHICDYDIKELHVENGTVLDCKGCSYKTCNHYSKQKSCFYGGVMVKEILPEIEKANALVWICPNYNDAVSSNLMAVINRMTALYRRTKFFDKTLFSVIVSGNSGSDSVARQLIGALNINKSFRLAPYFAIMATANAPGAVKEIPGIEERAKEFAENIRREIKA